MSLQEWTPCFDVTPAALIEGIITDMGLLPKKNGAFDVPAFTHSQVSVTVSSLTCVWQQSGMLLLALHLWTHTALCSGLKLAGSCSCVWLEICAMLAPC